MYVNYLSLTIDHRSNEFLQSYFIDSPLSCNYRFLQIIKLVELSKSSIEDLKQISNPFFIGFCAWTSIGST